MVNRSIIFIAVTTIAISLLVVSIILVDLAGKDGTFDKHLYSGGIGVLVFGCFIVYSSMIYYFHSIEKAIITDVGVGSQGATPRALISEMKAFIPTLAVLVYLVEAYGFYLIFHLRAWSVAAGSTLLLLSAIITLRFMWSSGVELERIAMLLNGGGPAELQAAMELNPLHALVRRSVHRSM